ncbi:MAG: dihydroorotate dehydrogenase [Candidatus Roizmanbacteria bacterium]|nr:dihydroorotate dehydrogenase [Candidatus Roizmanbacteria bacterium]
MNLSVNLAGIPLKNPTILASGIMGVSASSLKFVEENGAGAVTIKSIGPTDRTGHKNPTVLAFDNRMVNAVGLSNPGVDTEVHIVKEAHERLSVPLIVSIFADTIDNFAVVADKLLETHPKIIELNLSCPNTDNEFGKMFALDADDTRKVITLVKKITQGTDIRIFAKLTPEEEDFAELGKVVEDAGADGITTINTIFSMNIDIYSRKPILSNAYGGISGPAIKPVGIESVYTLYETVSIPIIGMGGILTGEDAIEYIMAGATAVGIGSGVYYRGIDIFQKVTSEIEDFMKKEGYKSIEEMRGIAHNS